MSYGDRYRGRKLKDPPSGLGRMALFLLVGMAFAGFVGTLRGRDAALCTLATVSVVAIKLIFDLLQKTSRFKLPEKLTSLPVWSWLLAWLTLAVILWLVLKAAWPQALDPSGVTSGLSVLCLLLFAPTLMGLLAPEPKPAETKTDEGGAPDTVATPPEKIEMEKEKSGGEVIKLDKKRKTGARKPKRKK